MTSGDDDSRPPDHIDGGPDLGPVLLPRLGPIGWARWAWRQLTSMHTALVLLLLLAVAAVPGSLFPQRTSDPNGVIQYFRDDPDRAAILDSFGLFGVYSSPWFSAIYLLLFISLIGCVIPRTRHHLGALLQPPPRTPARLSRLPEYRRIETPGLPANLESSVDSARATLKRLGYRTITVSEGPDTRSVSAERGYLRETGNLVFHVSLIFILASIAIGGGFSYSGQRVIVEGQTFVSNRAAYDSFKAGPLFNDSQLPPFAMKLDEFTVSYIEDDIDNLGFITDYRAAVSITNPDASTAQAIRSDIRVNEPLSLAGSEIYLLGNGYAPLLTVKDPQGTIVFSEPIPFLPQDSNLTSLGVVKLPDGLSEQVGLLGFFYPTKGVLANGAFTSVYPDLQFPVLTLNVFTGDLGIDSGTPKSVYSLDTSEMQQLTGAETGIDSLQLVPGQSTQLPNGLGSIELEEVRRFASFDIAFDPTKAPVLIFVCVMFGGLMLGLFIPRRRMWVRVSPGLLEYGALSRGDDPTLSAALDAVVRRHQDALDPHPDYEVLVGVDRAHQH